MTRRASSLLRADGVNFKVVIANETGAEWFVIPEEYKAQAFDLVKGNSAVIYLDFARVAYLKKRDTVTSGEVLGEFKAVHESSNQAKGGWTDKNLNQSFAIV